MNNDVEFLNNLLDKIGVKGFSFFHKYYLSIKIPNYNYHDYCLIGCWSNLNDLFKNGQRISINYIIQNIIKTHAANDNLGHTANYLGINDTGLDFLRCFVDSSSSKELKLKLSIIGY